MKKGLFSYFLSILIICPSVWAKEETVRSENIFSWEEIVAPKGYILSNDLYYQRLCSKVWSKQVPAFQKKNPHVQDPDVIIPGEKITVQICHEVNTAPPLEIKKVEKPCCEDCQVCGDKKTKEAPVMAEEDFTPQFNPYINLYLGFISEHKDDVATNFGFSVWGDVFKHVGYNIRLNFADTLITMQNEGRLKTAPGKVRGHLIYGLGNRLGLKNKPYDRLTKGVDSFSYLGLGLELNPRSNYKLQFDLTSNISEHFSLNAAASAMKKIGDDMWLGAYAEILSTRSAIDKSAEDRRYITGGIKFSF